VHAFQLASCQTSSLEVAMTAAAFAAWRLCVVVWDQASIGMQGLIFRMVLHLQSGLKAATCEALKLFTYEL
jgi:hypothetical protein